MELSNMVSDHLSQQCQIKSDKINHQFALLFDVAVDSSILIIGAGFGWLNRFFKNISSTPTDGELFDLIFYSPANGANCSAIKCEIEELQKKMSERGLLFLLQDNLCSFSFFKNLIKRKEKIRPARARCTFWSFSNLIRSSSFGYCRILLPVANFGFFEEVVDLKYGKIDSIDYEHWLLRFLNLLGMRHYIHESFLSICGQRALEDGRFFKQIKEVLKSDLKIREPNLRLIRFNLRARGALVVWIKERISDSNFIVRIVGNKDDNSIIRKNQDFLIWLSENSRISESLSQYLPRPVGCSSVGSCEIYVERMLPGMLAWKVNSRNLQQKIYRQADKFITDLGRMTSKQVVVEQDFLKNMFSDDIERIVYSEVIGFEFKKTFCDLLTKIQERLIGETVITVVAHGDYGYGNILVSPNDGELTGVIDWDTGRKTEFFWVDRLNMELQLLRSREQKTLLAALEYLWNKIDNRQDYTIYHTDYLREFRVSPVLFELLMLITIIKFISRSAQYDDLFRSEKTIFEKILIASIGRISHLKM